MPNHVYQKLEVEAPPEVLAELKETTGGTFDPATFHPVPPAEDSEELVGPSLESRRLLWKVENWGSRAVYRADPKGWTEGEGSMAIKFRSAWEPASGAVRHLSERFPSATFLLYYLDEGWNVGGGSKSYHGGKLVGESEVWCDRANRAYLDLCGRVGYED